jgi:hypothetical protein
LKSGLMFSKVLNGRGLIGELPRSPRYPVADAAPANSKRCQEQRQYCVAANYSHEL